MTSVAALLKSCQRVPALGRLYGDFFEAYAHRIIMQGGIFEVYDTLEPGSQGRRPVNYGQQQPAAPLIESFDRS